MHSNLSVAAVLVALATAASADAADVVGPIQRMDDTGMARCAVDGAFSSACAGTGQDGESGRDANAHERTDGRAGFRYVRVCGSGQDAGAGTCPAAPQVGTGPDDWACTRDVVTGLLWELKQQDGSIRDRFTLVSMANWGWGFATATELRTTLDAVAACGSTSWDTPTMTELLSLVDFGIATGTRIDQRFFPNTPVHYEYAVPYPRLTPDEGNYYGIAFGSGTRAGAYPGDGTYVRLVTRPSLAGGPRYAVGADPAVVSDRWTNLVWRRCRLGTNYVDGACVGDPKRMTWATALEAANGTPGWRLPNVKELASLTTLDDGQMDGTAFLGVRDGRFWSSTPDARGAGAAWRVQFDDYGALTWGPAAVDDRAMVYLVRDR